MKEPGRREAYDDQRWPVRRRQRKAYLRHQVRELGYRSLGVRTQRDGERVNFRDQWPRLPALLLGLLAPPIARGGARQHFGALSQKLTAPRSTK